MGNDEAPTGQNHIRKSIPMEGTETVFDLFYIFFKSKISFGSQALFKEPSTISLFNKYQLHSV